MHIRLLFLGIKQGNVFGFEGLQFLLHLRLLICELLMVGGLGFETLNSSTKLGHNLISQVVALVV